MNRLVAELKNGQALDLAVSLYIIVSIYCSCFSVINMFDFGAELDNLNLPLPILVFLLGHLGCPFWCISQSLLHLVLSLEQFYYFQ